MHNIRAILKRDLHRLLTVPAAWVILVGLIAIPPLYALVNIVGFWNPYGNTKSIAVAVANEDEGATNAIMGDMNLGKQIVDQLATNDELGWRFMDETQAMDAVRSGTVYAAIVLPKDFSSAMSDMLTGSGTRPQIDYYVNEKANAIAPKITDVGANTIDQTVNSTFVSTVGQVVSNTLNTAIGQGQQTTTQAQQAIVDDITQAKDNVSQLRASIGEIDTAIDQAPAKIDAARQSVATAERVGKDASTALGSSSTLITNATADLGTFAANLGNTLDQGSLLLSQASSGANIGVTAISGGLVEAQHHIGFALETGKAVTDANAALLSKLEALNNPTFGDLIAKLKADNADTANALNDLSTLNDDATATTTDIAQAANSLNSGTQNALAVTSGARGALSTTTLPQLGNGLIQLGSSAGTLSATISSQQSLIDQTNTVLDQLDTTLTDTKNALQRTDQTLATVQTRLDTISTDVSALSTSALLQQLLGKDGKLDANKISEFMLSPTVLDTQTLFPLNSYGSGMAPLFTDLALWVGSFSLVVILKLEVDDEGLEDLGLTATQRYLGRWLLLAPLAVCQALVATGGDLILGVQTASAPMFMLTGVLSALTYLSIIFALAVTFQHVGKGICVLLVIVQIPGASGLYPIEMMPEFFRRFYPFFPFTYSIDAMRETVGGFYDGLWIRNVAFLALFAALAFLLGLVIRPYLSNLNRMFAREIAESDMIVGEEFHTPSRGPKLAQAIMALANHDEYRRVIEARAARFTENYPKYKRAALIAGIIVPAIFCVVFALNTDWKLAALASWIIWLLAIIGALLLIETTRFRIERQMQLGALSDEDIRRTLYAHEHEKAERRRKRAAHHHERRHAA